MKYIVIIIVIVLSSCNNKKEIKIRDKNHFEKILTALGKSYTQQNIPENDLILCWDVTRENFVKDSLEYRIGIDEFYRQRMPFIKYLIENKIDDEKINTWIYTRNKCSSQIEESDLISDTMGVIILVDNLMIKSENGLVRRNYIEKISIKDLRGVLLSKEDIKFDQIQKAYKKFVIKLDR